MAELLRLFVASPGDVKSERKAMTRVVDEINVAHGPALGYHVELVRWETHAAPSAGRPQGVINEQIGDYDVFVDIAKYGTVESFRQLRLHNIRPNEILAAKSIDTLRAEAALGGGPEDGFG